MTETTSTLTSTPSPTTESHDLSTEAVHDKVSAAYARAVTRKTAGGCCTPATPKGVAAKTAGYSAEELAELPAEAVTNSFGCGNTLAFAEVRPGDVLVDPAERSSPDTGRSVTAGYPSLVSRRVSVTRLGCPIQRVPHGSLWRSRPSMSSWKPIHDPWWARRPAPSGAWARASGMPSRRLGRLRRRERSRRLPR